MPTSLLASLIPVMLCIGLGYAIARVGWVRESAIPDLSNIVFLVLTPALLFRTMGAVHPETLDFRPVLLYFSAAALIFAATLVLFGFSTRSAARALAHTFSNTVMVGVPIISFVFGAQGLVILFTLISLHSLFLLTAATLVFELAAAREAQRAGDAAPRSMGATLWQAARKSIIHPVPLPILAGLLYAQTGWAIPAPVDKALAMVGGALGPMALLLVGVTLAYTHIGQNLRQALGITLVKNLVMPALVLLLAPLLGVSGVALAVMFVTAAMPVGANVFYFTQRYGAMQSEVASSIAVSTLMAGLTLPLALFISRWL